MVCVSEVLMLWARGTLKSAWNDLPSAAMGEIGLCKLGAAEI